MYKNKKKIIISHDEEVRNYRNLQALDQMTGLCTFKHCKMKYILPTYHNEQN